MGRLADVGGGDVNTPEEHAAAVMRAPGAITVASIAGAIRAYADEIKGSQIEQPRSQLETKLQKHLSAAQGQIAELARQRDAEREARQALEQYVQSATPDLQEATRMREAALELAAKLP